MKNILIPAFTLVLLAFPAPAQAEADIVKGSATYESKTYLNEVSRPKPKPPVPIEMGARHPSQIEPAAGGETKGTRPYEAQRQLQEKIRLPRKD